MTKVTTTTSFWADEPGTVEEIVARYVTQGWRVVAAQGNRFASLQHPGLNGTRLVVGETQ